VSLDDKDKNKFSYGLNNDGEHIMDLRYNLPNLLSDDMQLFAKSKLAGTSTPVLDFGISWKENQFAWTMKNIGVW
jgi:hypothetical protein